MAKTLLKGSSSGNNQSSTIYTVPSNKYAQVTIISFGNPNSGGYNWGFYQYAASLKIRATSTDSWILLVKGSFPYSGIVTTFNELGGSGNVRPQSTGNLNQNNSFIMTPSMQLGVSGELYAYYHYNVLIEEVNKTTVEA